MFFCACIHLRLTKNAFCADKFIPQVFVIAITKRINKTLKWNFADFFDFCIKFTDLIEMKMHL